MEQLLNELILKHKKHCADGTVASYIPGLSLANPNDLGIAIIQKNNQEFFSGDYNKKFTIQSISKIITLMYALTVRGEEFVFEKVHAEPSGDPFNSIRKLETAIDSRPFNPMINAGAIVVSSMIQGENLEDKWNKLLDFFKLICENENLEINYGIYLGEKTTGNKNRAMAYLMKSNGVIDGDVEDALDIYFRQCSVEVTARDLAKIALLLSKNGLNSKNERIISPKICKIVKGIMITCGLYDGSGEFAIKVGIPAKSGVGGGILAVSNEFGIGVYGPALNEKGNSLSGLSILQELSDKLNLCIF